MKRFLFISLGLLVFIPYANAESVVIFAGQEKAAAVCSQCHGIKTPSANAPFPSLAGRDEAYLKSALKQYRDKTRKSDIMNAISGSLTDADINNIAAYYSKQKP